MKFSFYHRKTDSCPFKKLAIYTLNLKKLQPRIWKQKSRKNKTVNINKPYNNR